MPTPSRIKYRAAALLALPLISVIPAAAWAQEGSAADMPIVGARSAVATGGSATPQGGMIRTFSGSVTPQGGMIRTFSGDATPQGGMIRTFEGDANPLGGMIRTFSGDIEPFVGMIRTFEGNVDPQGGMIRTFEGDIDPYGGMIRTFWGTLTPQQGALDPQVGMIRTFSEGFLPHSRVALDLWAASEASGDYAQLVQQLRTIERDAGALWGGAVQQQTGKSFTEGFSQPFFAKWGVDFNHPQSLAGWDAFDRQRMMLDWYDNVLLYSGMDRVDHWMNAVNWTPKLTQTQGSGSRAVIGLIDFFAAEDADVRSKVIYSGGYQNVHNAHGAAVGSLMVASHDGRGVMGIVPQAQVAAYNPFDETMTASWADVKNGMLQVARRGASVINLSLGVPGHTLPADWRDVFKSREISAYKDQAIYVIAAGNDGVVQTDNINMKDAFDSTFIVVGSVDPNGQISAFSNTPGTACLTHGSNCKNTQVWSASGGKFKDADYLKESGLLMNRFIVAPGEMILVSDGHGGVTRMSGTSFAAPLVSGAIALLHDRWPWLKQYPRDVAKIILESAQDLGAPGVDPIYGHGMLDVEAAQSALDFNQLKYYLVDGRSIKEVKIQSLRNSGIAAAWRVSDMFFSAFEKIDSTERDFLIPLSSRLFGTSFNGQQMQDFLYHRLVNWLGSSNYSAGFTDSNVVPAFAVGDGWSMAMRGRTEHVASLRGDRTRLLASFELSNPERGVSFAFGSGDGAVMLGGTNALQMSTDFAPGMGGANPLLGFASGDAHMNTRLALNSKLDVSLGFTRQDRAIEQDLALGEYSVSDRVLLAGMDGYEAQATIARLDYRPVKPLTLSMSYTRLEEEGAFFGVRSLERADFGDSTVSDGLSLAADAQLSNGFGLFASGTMSVSNSKGDAAMGINQATGTAFQAGFTKQALLGEKDHLRVALAQPLTVERGYMDMQTVAVVDRETGEKDMVTQRVAIGAPEQRRYRMEAYYGTDLMEGLGSLGLFGSAELRHTSAEVPGFTVGGNMRLAF